MSDVQTTPATDIIHIESLILNHQSRLDEIKRELRENREMIKDMLEGNPEYVEFAKVAKVHIQNRNTKKKEILSTGEAKKIEEKTKDYNAQTRELKEALSDYLKTYQQLSGSNLLETPDGRLQEIVYTAKLVTKKESGQR